MVHGCQSRPTLGLNRSENISERHWYYGRMLEENYGACAVRLIECFMEAAPQLTLQVYIMSRYGINTSEVLCKSLT